MLMNYYWHLDRDQFQFDFLVNKEKPGFFDDEVRSLGGRIFMGPGLSPLKYPEYLRYMKTLLDREKEIKVLHAHNEAMEFYALNGAKKAGFPVRIAHAHNTHLPHGLKLPVKVVCKAMIPGAATDYFACGREAGIYYFGEKRWNESGVCMAKKCKRNYVYLAGNEKGGAGILDCRVCSRIRLRMKSFFQTGRFG